MTVHKLTAGDGYTYLTRQVASGDELRAGQSLADYYVARGNPAGQWVGRGAATLGLEGTVVSEAQMRALFGSGYHPDREAMLAAGASEAATKLGQAYPVYKRLAPYEDRVADAVAAFTAEHGREPASSERNAIASKEARRDRRAIAGFDLVFSPVKSASVLWGLGGPEVRQAVEDAHHEAINDVLVWLETHAAFTRSGHAGVAQVDTTGLLAVAFDHRESRSGDPDLHTHVAVANKVCGLDGRWRSLDARGLHALGVAASERYNTGFEDAMARRLGVVFEDRPGGRQGKRVVREIAGVPRELLGHFSKRRAAIEARYSELRAEYRTTHGREPGRSAQLQLTQQATLETREGKVPGRTLAEQVEDWTTQAATVVGHDGVAHMLETTIHCPAPAFARLDDSTVDRTARDVLRTVAADRATWTRWNLYAETERALRPVRFATAEARHSATEAVVARASSAELAIRITEPQLVVEPAQLTRGSDGESVYVQHGSERYTTSEVLQAEDFLIQSGQPAGNTTRAVDPLILDAVLAGVEADTGVALDPGQQQLVTAFTRTTAQLAVGIGPAGAGKTTAMRAFTDAWQASGGRVVLLATSSKAAQVLGEELGARAENLHKFLHENRPETWPENQPGNTRPVLYDAWFQLRPGDCVLVDEAGMAGTLQLAELQRLANDAGATVRLLGDPAQLAAVDAGGALKLLEREVGAAYLTELHRFTNPDEGHATLALRNGDTAVLDFYETHDRIRTGSRDGMLEAAYDAWATDITTGKRSVLIASANSDVTGLNVRARLERVENGQVSADGVTLRDGTTAGVGDWVLTRSNARVLTYRRGKDWVRNGDAWTVQAAHSDGSMTLTHAENGARVKLPASYVSDSVELGYAVTAHRVQGTTTDTAHALVTPEMTREALYVASTRGRDETTWYAATDPVVDVHGHGEHAHPVTARELLTAVITRSGAEESATDTIRRTHQDAQSLRTLVARYTHARNLAAGDALTHAAEQLPDQHRGRVLADPAAPRLARVLADAAGRGADPGRLIAAAWDANYDSVDLEQAVSPASVLATRIEDYGRTLTRTTTAAATGEAVNADNEPKLAVKPLPWLPAPEVGHAGWAPYLRARAELITQRATELGSLGACYREQYAITSPGDLGREPNPDTDQHQAYEVAEQERASTVIESGPSASMSRAPQHVEPAFSNPRRLATVTPITRPPLRETRGPRLGR